MKQRVAHTNPRIFRQCRMQIGLSVEEAQKRAKIRTLDKIENGELQPTFGQLEELARMYQMPQWVFLREKLPEQYDFGRHIPSFRQFAGVIPAFENYNTRVITARVEQLRELILEFRTDMEESIEPFAPPPLNKDISQLAQSVREWLGLSEPADTFEYRKNALENKGVFVFMTSKFPDWSKISPSLFRGFAIHKDILPIIVINDSDSWKAQSFTLFHELGHLLHTESSVDVYDDQSHLQQQTEDWCDAFATEVLMPKEAFVGKIQELEITGQTSIDAVKIDTIAKYFKVSSLACATKLLHLGRIDSQQYREIKKFLDKRYKAWQEQHKEENTPIRRNIAKEKLRQYGSIYSRTLVQAYHDQEIGLHKLCKLFGFKRATDALKLEGLL